MALANPNVVVNCDEEVKPKRRYTLNNSSGGRYNNNKRKRRNDIVLPTKFLLGGNIHDPLNLASFSGAIDQVTPESSPLPTPKHKKEVEVLIPVNLSDPLNLNSSDPEAISPIPVSKIIKSRKRKRKRTDSETTVDDETVGIGGDSSVHTEEKNKNESSINKESTNKSSGIDPVNGTVNDQQAESESVIPSKCPKTSASKKDVDHGIKGAGLSRGSGGDGHLFKKPNKDTEKISGKTNNNHYHHHSRPSHSRFSRGQTHPHPHNFFHRQRQNQQQQMQHNFRAKDAKFQYGNYDRYYGYRNQNLARDPRIKAFKEEWFEDQDILDIGCNVGHVTLTIARDFNPRKIVGIDIDEKLIRNATWKIKTYVNSNQSFLRKRLDTEVLSKNKCQKSEIESLFPVEQKSSEKSLENNKKDCDVSSEKNEQKTETTENSESTKCLQSTTESLPAPSLNLSTDIEPESNIEPVKKSENLQTSDDPDSNLIIRENVCSTNEDVSPISLSTMKQTNDADNPSCKTNEPKSSTCSIDQSIDENIISQKELQPDQSKISEPDLKSVDPSKSSSSPSSTVNPSQPSNEHNALTPPLPDATCTKETHSPDDHFDKSESKTKIKLDFSKSLNFPQNVQFICHNYVLDSDDLLKEVMPEYDCILCLSVTKWIHLNFGDDGLKRAFKRMYAQLKPGGKLILEAQPWCSYKKKKFASESVFNNYWSIKLKPEHFNEYLLSKEVGFSTLELVDIPEHESKGFRRPIFLLRKSKENT